MSQMPYRLRYVARQGDGNMFRQSTSAIFISGTLLSQDKLFTHCILVDSSTVVSWMSQFDILGMSGLFCHFYSFFDGKSCCQTM